MNNTAITSGYPHKHFAGNRVLLMAVSALTLAAPFIFSGAELPVLCPMHGIFGLPCPGCGLGRAFTALSQGDFLAALKFHVLAIPFALLLVVAFFTALYELIARKRLSYYDFMYSMKIARGAMIFTLAYHFLRFTWLLYTGALYTDYIQTSWTYSLFFG